MKKKEEYIPNPINMTNMDDPKPFKIIGRNLTDATQKIKFLDLSKEFLAGWIGLLIFIISIPFVPFMIYGRLLLEEYPTFAQLLRYKKDEDQQDNF